MSDGILRRSYPEQNQPTKIEIELWPTSNVFRKGHQIRIEVSSSNFPRYDRNLNTGDLSPTAVETKIAHQIIHHSKQFPSHIVLPFIP
ncbi:CocE/NonD family hydrolase [Kiloniella sp.]|uniref:CocE/NonD family hydrolase n=1 Tax=Kiloniella sp. TaxID=1938587 RepID=UPI003B020046